MDNIREITSAKKAPFSVRAENEKNNKQKPSIPMQELKALIADHVNESIAAATTSSTKQSFIQKVINFIRLRHIVYLIIGGVITATGTEIVKFKHNQIKHYEVVNSSNFKIRVLYNSMYYRCRKNKFLDEEQENDFAKDRDQFKTKLKATLDDDSYSMTPIFFDKTISYEKNQLTNKFMNISSTLTNSCSSLNVDPDLLFDENASITASMRHLLIFKWWPSINY